MPWFKAKCGTNKCKFLRNFEAKDLEEAQEVSKIDHQIFSPLCLHSQSVEESDVQEETFDETCSAKNGGHPFIDPNFDGLLRWVDEDDLGDVDRNLSFK